MTTVVEVAERLARRLKKGSLPALSMAEAMDVVEAINAGLQECYELLPSWRRRTTVSLTLAAPVSVNLSLTNGSVDLSGGGDVFTTAQVGRSVVVDGDANWNEVQSTTKLLDEYQGATGVRAATIYGDSVYNDVTTFDGLIGAPILADSRKVLAHFNPRAAGQSPEIGEPRYFWTEPASAALGASPLVYIRVFPAPDRVYVLRCDMEFRPTRLRYENLHQAATLALQDQLIERALIPLCEWRLLRSPAWAAPELSAIIRDDAEAARALLRGQRQSVATPSNRVGTPPGW